MLEFQRTDDGNKYEAKLEAIFVDSRSNFSVFIRGEGLSQKEAAKEWLEAATKLRADLKEYTDFVAENLSNDAY